MPAPGEPPGGRARCPVDPGTAGHAGIVAGAIAAHALRTETGRALVGELAGKTAIEVTPAPDLAISPGAIRIARAVLAAGGGGRIAPVRHADLRRAGPAAALAVAHKRADDGVAVTAAGGANRVRGPEAALARAVALAVEAAGYRRLRGQASGRRGASPAGLETQMPAEPGASQRVHSFPHAVAQQTPSAQKPLAQSPADAQGRPFGNVGRMLPRIETTVGGRARAAPDPALPAGAPPAPAPPRVPALPAIVPWSPGSSGRDRQTARHRRHRDNDLPRHTHRRAP